MTTAPLRAALHRELSGESAGERADLALAAEAAVCGGEAALAYYGAQAPRVRSKAPGDPVTEADHASNDAIVELLRRERPDDPLHSEELPRRPAADAARLWVVDPLDGTKEFLARNDEFSVMVGLAVDGAAVLGAVYQPAARRLYLGDARGGAWSVEQPVHEPTIVPLAVRAGPPSRLRFVRSRSHPDRRLRELERALPETEAIIYGSVGIKCALIATNQAELYVHPVPYLKEWDTCAPEAVLRGAGGRVTDCAGGPLRYGKRHPEQPGGIFAAHPDVWSQVAPIVRTVTRGLFE